MAGEFLNRASETISSAHGDEGGRRPMTGELPVGRLPHNSEGEADVSRRTDCSTEDAKTFGENVWVYCRQHLRPHQTNWCTVSVDQKELLEATSMEAAYAECKQRGFTSYSNQ